jgi:hypothetical protein
LIFPDDFLVISQGRLRKSNKGLSVRFEDVESRAIPCNPKLHASRRGKSAADLQLLFWHLPFASQLHDSLIEMGIEHRGYPADFICPYCARVHGDRAQFRRHITRHLKVERQTERKVLKNGHPSTVAADKKFDHFGYYYLCRTCRGMTARPDSARAHLELCMGWASKEEISRELDLLKARCYVL